VLQKKLERTKRIRRAGERVKESGNINKGQGTSRGVPGENGRRKRTGKGPKKRAETSGNRRGRVNDRRGSKEKTGISGGSSKKRCSGKGTIVQHGSM